MENINESSDVAKQRHGCVNAWLILMIIGNSATAILYLFTSEMTAKILPGDVSSIIIIILGILGIGNVIFSILLFQWKIWGFWGLTITSIVTLFINLTIGSDTEQSLFGLLGIVILIGVLLLKKDNVTTWENLK